MNVKILLITLPLMILLSGCSWRSSPEPIQVATKCEQKTQLKLKEPEVPKFRKVQWFVITEENQAEVFKNLKDKKIDPVLFGITDTGYEGMSYNLLEMRNFTNTQRNIIKEYKEYYESDKKE